MVLWEITLGTAYFLGLKRTYRLALKLQRRVIGPKHPKIRQFLHRRTRAVFDVALKVHKNIQERDIEVGRNLGNRVLRWLDRLKPSAEIRGPSLEKTQHGPSVNMSKSKQTTNSSHLRTPGSSQPTKGHESGRNLFTATNIWHKSFPSIAVMVRPTRPAGTMIQFRHLCIGGDTLRLSHPRSSLDGVIRKDIMQWMLQK